MGTNCSSHSGPDLSNRCSSGIPDKFGLPNFCTLAGPAGDDRRHDYCGRIGNGGGEWTYAGQSGGCSYNDCDNVTDFGGGCCNGCCGIAGAGTNCQRTSFKADPLTCCLRDQVCQVPQTPAYQNACFQDDTQTYTCDPSTRDQSSPGCQNAMLDWCSGIKADGTKEASEIWIARWLGDVTVGNQTFHRPCYNAVYRNLYAGAPGVPSLACLGAAAPTSTPVSSAGYIYAQNLLAEMMGRYREDGGDFAAPESSQSNNQLSGMLNQLCRGNPGLCSTALYRYCANTTVDSLQRNIAQLPWCGCYMPPEQYSRYTDLYQINRECTPTCNHPSVIPLPGLNGVGSIGCTQSLCVIDDVSINLTRAVVGAEGIQFNQLCPSCGNAGAGVTCSCFLTGTTIDAVASNVSINISQQCEAGSSKCWSETKGVDGTITSVQVPCYSGPILPGPAGAIKTAETWRIVKILLVFAVLAIVLLVTWLIVYPRLMSRGNPGPDPSTSSQIDTPRVTTPIAVPPPVLTPVSGSYLT